MALLAGVDEESASEMEFDVDETSSTRKAEHEEVGDTTDLYLFHGYCN